MSHKQKGTPKEKEHIVQQCLENQLSHSKAAELMNVDGSTIRRWIKKYLAEGIDAFLPYAKNRVYTAELKLNAVRDYLVGLGSLKDVCQKYKIRDERQLRSWIEMYNTHKDFNSRRNSGGGSYMRKSRNTTQEERIQISKECLKSGKNYGEIALKYNVSYHQARAWTQRFEVLGETGLEDRRGRRKKDQLPRTELESAQIEIKKLKHQLYLAEMERDLLKKVQEIERGDVFHK